ncbi:AAA family ATPase [Roseovarius salinarum]|uniref:AAA family ATPase n=1 Tax=Roseovarius salinarum TaxID=1981892 RepID=UPI000C331C00|nr:AAA family ATPase [Roseovarius salinarum]
MKLRAIHLTNVRRFAGETASITGIGDGVTTISAPNESGKSTFFDALHALFFLDHKSQAQEIKSLQPYAKGAVRIAADVEDPQGRAFRLEKSFLSRKAARVTDLANGRVIAQEGEAEDWIARFIGAAEGAPAGLLWVRQGATGMEPAGSGAREKSERARLREARQTLMSSVAGEVDNITGGRRMDAIMKKCTAELEALATQAGNPKAGGAWARARAEVAALEAEEAELSGPLSELTDALEERAELRRQSAADADPDRDAQRAEALRAAREAVETARAHAARVEEARQTLRLAQIEADRAGERADSARRAREADAARRTAAGTADAALERATEDLESRDADLAHEEKGLRTAVAVRDEVAARLAAVRDHEKRRERAARHEKLVAQMNKARGFVRAHRTSAEFLAGHAGVPDLVAEVEARADELAGLTARREASAPRVSMDYDGAARVLQGQAPVEPGTELPIVTKTVLALPGIGRMTLRPSGSVDADHVARAEDALADVLDRLGVETRAQARALHETWQAATREKARAEDALAVVAPEGVDALRQEIEALEAEGLDLSDEPPKEDSGALERALEAAETAVAQATTRRDTARESRNAAAEALAGARTEARLIRQAIAEAETAPGPEAVAERDAARDRALQARDEAHAALADLEAKAPDLEALEAELERVRSAQEATERTRAHRQERLATLDGLIGARAEDGVEYRLEECRDKLKRARERAARYAEEVAVLRELKAQLEAARAAARETYFEPVTNELLPLLKMLHPDAEVEMDPETMLPARIVRDGETEELDVLSGGAVEQVAILTRLAFARLYARQGREIPIILDDALVHSDDARIVKMFSALTRAARNQQILVFSCRTRAFEDLGGTRPAIERAPASG